jgi:oxalate decarboxylase/phosphoglucose isomerase-like protein (cupin superfamily)
MYSCRIRGKSSHHNNYQLIEDDNLFLLFSHNFREDPEDNVGTFEIGPGEIVFIPSAYFHYIENVNTSQDMQFAVFFNHERPEDICISGAFGAPPP